MLNVRRDVISQRGTFMIFMIFMMFMLFTIFMVLCFSLKPFLRDLGFGKTQGCRVEAQVCAPCQSYLFEPL